MNNLQQKKICIVGGGPRGLSALESLYKYYANSNSNIKIHTLIFEQTGNFGNGKVYAKEQTLHNWLNVSERALIIPERKEIKGNGIRIQGFPSFHKWIGYKTSSDKDIDIFPPRANLGFYLSERFKSIQDSLKSYNLLTMHVGLVTKVRYTNNKFIITTNKDLVYNADEVVLTVGHQPTYASKQIEKWNNLTKNNPNISLVTAPYPLKDIFNSNNQVALRGFGLSMIDVVRSIVGYTGGRFSILNQQTQEMEFKPGKKFPKRIFPFSLDGLPMAPKPINKKIDEWFIPNTNQLEVLKKTIEKSHSNANSITTNEFLIDAITPLIIDVYLKLDSKAIYHKYTYEELMVFSKAWIKNGYCSAVVCLPKSLPAETIIKHYVGMATGKHPISLDYCIGQVWRHCHPTLYKCLSYTNFSDNVIGDIIQLDNKLKRLTFGPPVASMQQLLAMIKFGAMQLKVVDDPDIQCTKKGWHLDTNDSEAVANIMINTVLDAPQITEVKSQLIKSLLEDNYIQPVHSKLGIDTYKNGIVITPNKNQKLPLALLGRLAKGTLFGVDAILECFNQRSDNWAEGAIKRFKKSAIE